MPWSDVCDFTGDVVDETEKAWLIDFDGRDEPTWMPKSQVERHRDHFMVPRWLAEQRGLV